jgi:hypothetical protein
MKHLELLVTRNTKSFEKISNLRSKVHERTLSHWKLNGFGPFLDQHNEASLAVWPEGLQTLDTPQEPMENVSEMIITCQCWHRSRSTWASVATWHDYEISLHVGLGWANIKLNGSLPKACIRKPPGIGMSTLKVASAALLPYSANQPLTRKWKVLRYSDWLI